MARLGAGVRKRDDGTLEKRFTINGKRYSVYGKTSKEIVQKEQELRKKIELGIYTPNRNITLDGYFKEWIEAKRNSIKGSTLKTHISYYNKHISIKLGKRKIQQIERREIINFQSELVKTLSVSTVNSIIKTLKMILYDAINDEIIVKNPAENIKAVKETGKKATETYHRALTEEEQRAFMQEIKNDYYYEFIAMLLCSGMRSGEAAALTWNDVDYEKNVIHITKTVTFTEKGVLIVGDSPKSDAGKRDIPINDTIKSVLQRQLAKMGNIVPMRNNNIFVSVYGGLIYSHAINRAISDALKRLEKKGIHIDHFTAHALRDTFATRYIEQGGQPQTLKNILGHNSLAMTMDLYAHVLPNTKQKEMENLKISI
ncbi:MAG: site-specific integrase [Lachnospiraceae bacterium]|nr:site-specific integrase [Lachnospiraceae bacterium]